MQLTKELDVELQVWERLPYEEQVWIPVDKMEVGWYLADGRNFSIGYWNGEEFEYTRHKWGMQYEATEYHWDTGAPHGTVKPIRKL